MRIHEQIKANIPEISTNDTYQWLAEDSTYRETDEHGNVTSLVEDIGYHAFIGKLMFIESFVKEVLSSFEPAFRMERKNGVETFVEKPLSIYFPSVISWYLAFSKEYEYSLYVDLFFNCCRVLKLEREHFAKPRDFSVGYEFTYAPARTEQWQLFNNLISNIRAISNTPEFKKKLNRIAEKIMYNSASAVEYLDALFKHRDKRLLVIRVDFSYRHDIAKSITVEQAKLDLEHFLNNRRGNKKLFEHWAGYIRRIEWGPEKGLHFHLVIFYRGSKRCKDVYLAGALGEYWKEITEGRGIYWNCNAHKDDYLKLGIGMIEQNDVEKRKILTDNVISYLIKPEQALRAKKLGEGKCFVRGMMPS
jgi:hypothetical protein